MESSGSGLSKYTLMRSEQAADSTTASSTHSDGESGCRFAHQSSVRSIDLGRSLRSLRVCLFFWKRVLLRYLSLYHLIHKGTFFLRYLDIKKKINKQFCGFEINLLTTESRRILHHQLSESFKLLSFHQLSVLERALKRLWVYN